MKLRRAVAAIGVLLVTTVLAEGTSLVTAPPGTSLMSQRHSPAGTGTSRVSATLKREEQAPPVPKLYEKIPRTTEAMFCREAVIR